MKEIYVSVDVESDGPIPGENSMLSFGAAAFDPSLPLKESMVSTFEINLKQLPEAHTNPDTMKWWQTQQEAWDYCRRDTQDPQHAMQSFNAWTESLNGKPVFVAYPAGYDFTFMYWYMIKFTGKSPYGFSALDLKSFAMAKLGTTFKGTTKKNMPKSWFTKHPHNHKALDDAIGQGWLFMNMKNDESTRSTEKQGR